MMTYEARVPLPRFEEDMDGERMYEYPNREEGCGRPDFVGSRGYRPYPRSKPTRGFDYNHGIRGNKKRGDQPPYRYEPGNHDMLVRPHESDYYRQYDQDMYHRPPDPDGYQGPPGGSEPYHGPSRYDMHSGPFNPDPFCGPPNTDYNRGPPGMPQPGCDGFRGPPDFGPPVPEDYRGQPDMGPHGPSAYPGPPDMGPHGPPGHDGYRGTPDRGQHGPDGYHGPPDRPRGRHGSHGPANMGPHGPPGHDGSHGPPPAMGPHGPPGHDGYRGTPDMGPPIPKGYQVPPDMGPPGPDGYHGSFDMSQQGPDGYHGPPDRSMGRHGSHGPPDIGLHGPPGHDGYRGTRDMGPPIPNGYQVPPDMGLPGPDGYHGPPDIGQHGPDGYHGPPDRPMGPPDRPMGPPDRPMGPHGPPNMGPHGPPGPDSYQRPPDMGPCGDGYRGPPDMGPGGLPGPNCHFPPPGSNNHLGIPGQNVGKESCDINAYHRLPVPDITHCLHGSKNFQGPLGSGLCNGPPNSLNNNIGPHIPLDSRHTPPSLETRQDQSIVPKACSSNAIKKKHKRNKQRKSIHPNPPRHPHHSPLYPILPLHTTPPHSIPTHPVFPVPPPGVLTYPPITPTNPPLPQTPPLEERPPSPSSPCPPSPRPPSPRPPSPTSPPPPSPSDNNATVPLSDAYDPEEPLFSSPEMTEKQKEAVINRYVKHAQRLKSSGKVVKPVHILDNVKSLKTPEPKKDERSTVKKKEESPARPSLDARLMLMFGAVGEKQSPDKKEKKKSPPKVAREVKTDTPKGMYRPLSPPPSPFRSKKLYLYWHSVTLKIRRSSKVSSVDFVSSKAKSRVQNSVSNVNGPSKKVEMRLEPSKVPKVPMQPLPKNLPLEFPPLGKVDISKGLPTGSSVKSGDQEQICKLNNSKDVTQKLPNDSSVKSADQEQVCKLNSSKDVIQSSLDAEFELTCEGPPDEHMDDADLEMDSVECGDGSSDSRISPDVSIENRCSGADDRDVEMLDSEKSDSREMVDKVLLKIIDELRKEIRKELTDEILLKGLGKIIDKHKE